MLSILIKWLIISAYAYVHYFFYVWRGY